ncbi:MAG: GyrI-like domain-containing protein [Cyclobacteriaceae bacterium]|nr:GyrI-like domain-containing protein [Cyclobacteriaceae bacterium]
MKKVSIGLGFVLMVALTYYIGFRPFEYVVTFKAATVPGDVIETIRIWNRSLEDAQIVEVDSVSGLRQKIVFKERSYIYNWRFTPVSDSLTNVTIQVSQPSKRLWNKLLVPFTTQPIEEDAGYLGKLFFDIIKTHLEITKVEIIGEASLDSSFCVCRSYQTDQVAKANAMMKDYLLVSSFVDYHKFKLNGPPMVRVNEWNHKLGKIDFDFCFPIFRPDVIPLTDSVSFKTFERRIALKAEYHGNYITSDRAWYQLMDYAAKNGYKAIARPVEVFHDNPSMGFNEKNWKADIYLPIVQP